MRFAAMTFGVLLLWPLTAFAAQWIVRPDGSGDFPTIQAAITAAAPGDSILLAYGVFTGDGNRDIDYAGKAVTVQSQGGVPEMCVIDCQGSWTVPHHGFSFHSGETSASVLRGVTIANGRTLPFCPGCAGGGVLCSEQSSPTLENCIFRENVAASSGGGLYCQNSSPSLIRCRFIHNAAEPGGGGGGMSCYCGSPVLFQCEFRENAAASGGGFICSAASSPKIQECLFQDNVATAEGGGMFCQESSAWLSACTFGGNQATFGGGVACVVSDSVALLGCTFAGNRAPYGGGLDSWDSHLVAGNTIIAFNTDGRAVLCEGSGTVDLACCDLYGNVDGDWIGCVSTQYGVSGNISADPLFCDPGAGNVRLQEGSPCGPDFNPECDRIGAWPVGCDVPQLARDEAQDSGAMIRSAPNPFVGETTIGYRLGPGFRAGAASVAIFDVAGRRVRQLQVRSARGAIGQVHWDGTDAEGRSLPGGAYLLRLSEDERTTLERLIKVR